MGKRSLIEVAMWALPIVASYGPRRNAEFQSWQLGDYGTLSCLSAGWLRLR
jgi:hypothetical protein